jgi:hypothetical protein
MYLTLLFYVSEDSHIVDRNMQQFPVFVEQILA